MNLNPLKRLLSQALPLIFVTLISTPTFFTLLRPGYFPMHDDLQAIRIYGMSECFREGQIPCRFTADMGYRFGYPQFNYYGPLPYYLMSLFNLAGVGLFDSVKIGFILSLLLGNVAMYFAAKELFKNNYAALAVASLYALAPYRASDIYSRGAMGEAWAFTIIPLITFFALRLVNRPNLSNMAKLGLSFGLLFATHNVTTLIFTPTVFLFALFSGILQKINLKNLLSLTKWLLSSILTGALISAFFLLPVILEKKFAHTETMIGGYFDYRAHFISFKQLFISTFWGYGSSEIGPTDDLSFFYSPVLLILLVLSLISIFINLIKRRHLKISLISLSLLVLGLFSTFMAHEKSSLIWKLLPPLVFLQFPWRFLVLGNFFFILGVGIYLFDINSKYAKWLGISTILLTFLVSISYFRPTRWLQITEQEKFSGYLWDRQMTISIFDYLPTSADLPPNSPAPILPSSSIKEASIKNYKTSSTSFSFEYQTSKEVLLKLNRLYFPGWNIYLNGKPVTAHYSTDGNMFLTLTPGTYQIEGKITDTAPRLIGNLLSLISIPTVLWLIFRKTS